MIRTHNTLLAAAVAATFGVPSVLADESGVWFYAWRGVIPVGVQQSFADQHDMPLVVDTFNVIDEAEARLAAGNSGYDLAIIPSDSVMRLARMGAISPLESLDITSKHVARNWVSETFTNLSATIEDYAVPFMWGTTGLTLNEAEIKARVGDVPLDSWDLLFVPEYAAALAECGISILDSVQEVVAITLNYLGRDPNSMVPDDLDAAFQTLGEIMTYVDTVSGDQASEVSQGDVCLALSWSTTGIAPTVFGGSDPYRFVVPREGAVLWADVIVAPREAETTEHGDVLLDFLTSGEQADAIAAYALAPNAYSSPEGIRSAMATNVQELTLPAQFNTDDLFVLTPRTGAEKRELDRRWRRLQLGSLLR